MVSLGTDCDFPKCECFEWKRTMLPCKHMLAVLETREDLNWESLSPLYRNSPFLSLDIYVIADKRGSDKSFDNDCFDIHIDNSDVKLQDIPKKVYPKISKASNWRDLLQQLGGLFLCIYENEFMHFY